MNIWTVVRRRIAYTKRYTYALRASERQDYLFDGYHMGRYRFKRDALNRARELNENAKAVAAKAGAP